MFLLFGRRRQILIFGSPPSKTWISSEKVCEQYSHQTIAIYPQTIALFRSPKIPILLSTACSCSASIADHHVFGSCSHATQSAKMHVLSWRSAGCASAVLQVRRQLFSDRSLRVRECTQILGSPIHMSDSGSPCATRFVSADRVSLSEAYLLHAYGYGGSCLRCSQPAYRLI